MTPNDLAELVRDAVREAVAAGTLVVDVPAEVLVQRPRNRDHGDYATNLALQLAGPARQPPRAVAAELAARIAGRPGIAKVDVAGPGFLNITLAEDALGQIARRVLADGERYGHSDSAAGTTVNLEFVSSNPTGPVHIGGTRWAAVGDAIARLLAATGAMVVREFYINDAGTQVSRFGESLLAAAEGQPAPADGYQGPYVAELAAELVAADPRLGDPGTPRPERLEQFTERGLAAMVDQVRATLERFGVHYDVWFSERSLADSGALGRALARLAEQGRTYERDGATWLATTGFGDDKDRVLVKSDGTTTYFASDAAYYLDKRSRGADRVVIMLGADHHGYQGRLRAMASCFGDDPDRTLELLIGQLVTVLVHGAELKMSKRAGTFVSLDDLLELTGVDAARYTLARQPIDSPMSLDVDLVTSQTNDNPVFYVQMAHARIRAILRNAAELGLGAAAPDDVDVSLLVHPNESALLGALGEFPRVVGQAAELRAPHRVARYAEDLAGAYHRFYDTCRVLPQGDEPAGPGHDARLLLCRATALVLANALALLGVRAPERM